MLVRPRDGVDLGGVGGDYIKNIMYEILKKLAKMYFCKKT